VLGTSSTSTLNVPWANVLFQEILEQDEVRIKKIFSVAGFCAALLDDNRVFTWGLNSDGQLGLG
jgi:alpha-tubulin suppressor-like RCC1 family protein